METKDKRGEKNEGDLHGVTSLTPVPHISAYCENCWQKLLAKTAGKNWLTFKLLSEWTRN